MAELVSKTQPVSELTTTLDKFILDVIANPQINKFITSCQTTGGFKSPTHEKYLLRLKTGDILKRLYHISENAIVAISELGEGKDNKTPIEPDTKSKIIPAYKSINDTCFMYPNEISIQGEPSIKPYDLNKKDGNKKCNSYIITYNTKKIMSIHFAGDGPIKIMAELVNKPLVENIIDGFLQSQLPDSIDDIDIICGDTNITEAKSNFNREAIIQSICDALNKKTNANWLVIMSECKVDKIRYGFLLPNQQFKKSAPDSSAKPEADGTIMAIKIPNTVPKESIATFIGTLPTHYSAYCNGYYHTATTATTEPVLQFEQDVATCSTMDGLVIDKIFLDHSVIQLPASKINEIFGANTFDKYPLISLNMGSIVNSGNKNWNTDNIDKLPQIIALDTQLWELVKDKLPELNLPEYTDINGKDLEKLQLSSSVAEKLKSDIITMIENSELYKKSQTKGGKRKKTKKRKLRKNKRSRKR